LKEATGCNFLRGKWILNEIDQFFLQNNITEPVITREFVLAWHKTRINDSPATIYSKYSTIAQLARYMSRQGCNCFIPRLPESKRSKSDFTPYIFTHNQIDQLLESGDRLRMYDRHMSITLLSIPAVLRLLYSTGLRVSEALSIKNADVKLENGYIHIRKTKNGSERIVPVNDSLSEVLKQYVSYRNRMPVSSVGSPNSFLFIKSDGTYCNPQSVYVWFRKILVECGIPFSGNHHGPRVHDLRHTFAVHAMVQMAHNNQDLYSSLPVISACLGHKSLFATEQYVRLTGEMYPELINQCSSINAFVYPKI
jgi:integrase